jgi:hypothetical protein
MKMSFFCVSSPLILIFLISIIRMNEKFFSFIQLTFISNQTFHPSHHPRAWSTTKVIPTKRKTTNPTHHRQSLPVEMTTNNNQHHHNSNNPNQNHRLSNSPHQRPPAAVRLKTNNKRVTTTMTTTRTMIRRRRKNNDLYSSYTINHPN